MKRSVKYTFFIFLFLFMSLTLKTGIGFAQKPNQTIEVDMGIMDDFGNILADYTKEFFVINNDHFIYRKPPVMDRYTFATANVLKLETAKGETYRVNYFYTLDSTEAGEVPGPLLMSEMPKKKVSIEKIKVVVSTTDESMREIAATRIITLDYFWDTFSIPVPKQFTGYGFQRLETGKKPVDGKSLPQLVYVYKRGGNDNPVPSLIFGHLVGEEPIRTIRPEYIPPVPATSPETKPATTPRTTPRTSTGTKPRTTPRTSTGTKPTSNPVTIPTTKPVSTAPAKTAGEVQTATPRTDSAMTTPGSVSVPGAVTTGPRADAGPNGKADDGRNTAVFLISLLGIVGIVIFFKIRK